MFGQQMDTALAQQFGRQIGTNSRTGQPIYSITNREGYNQALKAKQQAKDAGFASVDAMNINRQMRNQLESKAIASGMSIKDAYALVPGGNLTNTQALQEAWNKITVQPVAQQQTQQAAPAETQPAATQTAVADTGPSESEKMAQRLSDSIASLSKGFEDRLAAQAAESKRLAEEQAKRFETLQNQFQAQTQMMQRPDVMGVKTATGSGGDAMQIARRGVRGAFGRTGLRISSLNV